mgnify:CR=1 FL=1
MKRILLFSVLAASLLSSCTSDRCAADKDTFLDNYYELLEEARAANLPVSDKKWARYDERFRAYVEECYEVHEAAMSGREKRRFWRKSLSYYTQRYGDGAVQELRKGGGKQPKWKQQLKEWGL